MEEQVEITEKEQPVEVIEEEQPVEVAQKYDLHIKIAEEMRQRLKDSAELAYEMGEIAKPDLVDLVSLFIGWGLIILKKKWVDHMGYK